MIKQRMKNILCFCICICRIRRENGMKKIALTTALLLVLLFTVSCMNLRDASVAPTKYSPSGEQILPADPSGYRTTLLAKADASTSSPRAGKLEKPIDPYDGVSISLLAAGDNLIHPNITTDGKTRGTESKRYNFLPVYTDVADMIFSADIAFINQETVMAGESYGYSGWPTFNAPQDLGDDLVTLGFDVINIANNHMLDMGTQGLLDTIEFWKEKPITLIGGYENPDDYADIRLTEADGIKLAWLSYTYSTNGLVKASWSDAVIPYIDDELIVSDIARAHEISDFVIVSIHWGDENTQTPNSEQRRLASLMAESGADLILGHHSHTVQPIEWIKTDRKDVLCVYSLGNFISGMSRPVNVVGGILTLDIVGDGKGGLTVDNILFSPTVFWYGMDWYGTHLYRMSDFTHELAASHGVAIDGYKITVESAREFITDVIDEEFLPEYMKSDS